MTFLSVLYAKLPGFCQECAQTGLRVFVTSSLLLLAVFAAMRTLRTRGPAWSLLLCQSALGSIALCLLLSLIVNGRVTGSWMLTLPAAFTAQSAASVPTRPVTQAQMPALPAVLGISTLENTDSGLRGVSGGSVTVQAIPTEPAYASTAKGMMPPFANFLPSVSASISLTGAGKAYLAVVGIWLVVALALLSWLAACYAGVYRLVRCAEAVQEPAVLDCLVGVCAALKVPLPAILVSKEVNSVFLAGVHRPTILLPADYRQVFDERTLEVVLTHEVAHIRAREGWWTLAARLLCALCWIQPLLWRLCQVRGQAAEEGCDQAVLKRGHSSRVYADCLVSAAERLSASRWERVAGSGSVVFRSSLSQRIAKILDGSLRSPGMSSQWRVSIGAASVLMALCLSLIVAADPTQVDSSLDDDPALKQKVLISAEGVPMIDLLALVAQKTGVQIKADGFTADDKIILFGPSRPLKDSMADMAALFNDTWLHSKNGSRHTYRLTRNPRAREYEETVAGEMRRRILIQMDEHVRALNETPEQLAKRPQGDAIRQTLADKEGRNATSIFALLTPAQRLQLIDRWKVALPVSMLSPVQKDGIENLFHGRLFEQEPAPGASDAGIPVTQIQRAEMDQHDLTFSILKASGVDRQSTNMEIYLTAPTGMNRQVMNLRTDARFVLAAHGNPYTGAKVRPEALPAAQNMPGREASAWVDRLHSLAEKTGLSVMADYYRSKSVLVPAEEDGAADGPPSIQSLDTFCKPEGYLWWNRGKTLLFRKRDWYNQQLYEVPDRWILERVRRLKERKNRLTYADIISLEELTTNQIAGLNESLGKPSDRLQVMGLRELLAVIAAIPLDKETALPSGKVIGRDVTPAQVAVMPDLNDLHQRQLLTEFLRVYDRIKIEPQNVISGDFGFIVVPSGRNPNDAPEVGATSAGIMLYMGKGSIGVGYQVALPLALPEDRWNKTRVETGL
jgi:beta-lactamase regulating signal transducer with metallopeptidase domain